MSLENPTSIRPSLGITPRPQTLTSQGLADPSLLRANLPRALRASNQRVLLVQNQPPLIGGQLVNQHRSTRELNAIDVKGMDTFPASARVKQRAS